QVRLTRPTTSAPATPTALLSCHASPLELEAALAGAVSESLHPTVIEVPTTIENDLLDSLLAGALRDQLARLARLLRLGQICHGVPHVGGQRGDAQQRDPPRVVHDLTLDVVQRTVHDQTGSLRRTDDLLPYAPMPPKAPYLPFPAS